MDTARKWLVNFSAGKTQLVSFDGLHNSGGIDVKINASILDEKSSLEVLGLSFSSTLN